jgi:hypothetical protein
MKIIYIILIGLGIFANAIYSQTPVTVTVNMSSPGIQIPDDFIGFSFETRRVNYNSDEVVGYFFDSSNTQLVTLFKQLGIKSLRVGGFTVDDPKTPIPGFKDIDALFRFAKAAGVKVIYSLRIKNGDVKQNVSIAKYIWDHYKDYLDAYTLGNETDNYKEFSKNWKIMADAIVSVIPEAKFCGPAPVSSMDGGARDIRNFVADFGKTGLVKYVSAHDYPGGNALRNATDGNSGRDQMLSETWLAHYQVFYDQFVPTVQSYGLKYRFDEGSSFYKGGAKDASDTFASSLWCLDYMHWWAAHGCSGYNFHNNRWFMYNITICRDSLGNYQSRPQGYGIKAFDVGGHGRVVPVTISRPFMSAYGVVDSEHLFLTVINKEHGEYGRDFEVTVKGVNVVEDMEIMYLKAPENDVAATAGITLGGATINNTGTWQGKWTPLKFDKKENKTISLPVASAAIVKIKCAKK